jgi:hypothetical protein
MPLTTLVSGGGGTRTICSRARSNGAFSSMGSLPESTW